MQLQQFRAECARGGATFLPGRDAPLAWHALEVAELAGWLLASCDAPLLSITYNAEDPAAEPLVTPWPNDLAASPNGPADPCRYPTVLAALRRAALPLLEALRARWPDYARPARIGVVTDGSGVVFSANEPWPLAPDWLGRQVRASGTLMQILPFAATKSH